MMPTAVAHNPNRLVSWFQNAPWRILVAGILLALLVAAGLLFVLMNPPLSDVANLVTTLAITSVLSMGLGYLLYRRGWARSSSLLVTLIGTYVWAAVLTMFNVWIMQRQMFFSQHDLLLSGVLLLFAAIIATTYGLFVASSVTEDLRQLAVTADELAAGELDARVPVHGQNEIARVSRSFNDMAAQLQTAAEQRQDLDNLRRNLIAWTSHDLRTPLTSIRVRIEALNDGLVSEGDETKRYYQTIHNDVLSLNVLIDDLFELAQLEAGGLTIAISPGSLSDLISDCLESFQPIADQRTVALTGSVDPAVDPVTMNSAKISRVLSNLCGNAIRYTSHEGMVQVKAARGPEGVIVTVDDSGSGFASEDLQHVFDQFYRGEPDRSRSTGGAGLGLAIAQGIVEAHGGRIWAENRAEGGGRVAFLLPDSTESLPPTTNFTPV